MDNASQVRRRLDELVDRFAGPMDLSIPSAMDRGERAETAAREWSEGVDAERARAVALVRHLRDAATGSSEVVYGVLQYAVRAALDSADRWRGYYDATDGSGRLTLLARAEVASRLACALRELADESLQPTAN